MRVFVGVPRDGRQLSNDSNAWPVTVNFKMCTYLFTTNMYHLATPTDPFRIGVTYCGYGGYVRVPPLLGVGVPYPHFLGV